MQVFSSGILYSTLPCGRLEFLPGWIFSLSPPRLQEQPGPIFGLTPAQMQEGSFVIPKSKLAAPQGITSVTITLTGAKYGAIDSKFRSGNPTISRMRLEKKGAFN